MIIPLQSQSIPRLLIIIVACNAMLLSKEEIEIILFDVSLKKLKLILLIYKTINTKF